MQRRRGATRAPPPSGLSFEGPEYGLELAFEREVRRASPAARRELLGWLRHWRRRPGRIFWQVTARGEWRRL
jgi:hypothetical protein